MNITVTTSTADDLAIARVVTRENAARADRNAERTATWKRAVESTKAANVTLAAQERPLLPLPQAPTLEAELTPSMCAEERMKAAVASIVSGEKSLDTDAVRKAMEDPAKVVAIKQAAGVA